ncbi:hypothetical protein BGW38_003030 [Lunasporangiospora selenospora]|uniref:JmjC domain-containing protein n=1 Tax=Lunasporangiospora selenospora TaxID=979761 RepID=A0A9P6KHM1_9FUNG|nr:hypothetical protein BGW38_003030 [Lunasporangiospora selenospora]
MAKNDYIWKKIFFDTRNRQSTRFVYRGSWLLTYLFPGPEDDAACFKHALVTQPSNIQGVTSEFLHMEWTRSSMFFGHFYPPPSLFTGSKRKSNQAGQLTIPIEDYNDLDQEMFYRKYGYANRPVMIQNSGVESWPAWQHWALDALDKKYGHLPFKVSNLDGTDEPTFEMSYSDFRHYIRYTRDEDPLYLFDARFADKYPELAEQYKVPKYFEMDFFSLLDEEDRPPFRWILIGSQRTGAPWHTDPSGTSGHDPCSPERLSSARWYLDIYPYLDPESKPLEIVQHPGQTIYVPSGWWHMVLNMDDTVAVTQNFADETNLISVKASLKSDTKDEIQVHRWKVLSDRLATFRPDLESAIKYEPEYLMAMIEYEDASWNDLDSASVLDMWKGRVNEVLLKTTVASGTDEICPVGDGINMCFSTKGAFIKFFTPFFNGHSSFCAEVHANLTLKNSDLTAVGLLQSPALLGYGYLLEPDADHPRWQWPYIVTENVSQMTSVLPTLSGNASQSQQEELLEATDYLPWDDAEYLRFLPPILGTLDYYHTLPIDNAHHGDSVDDFKQQLSQRIQSAVLNHQRWRIFPKHLLELLPEYLPRESSEVFDPSKDVVANFVHGDISPSNILGFLQPVPDSSFPKTGTMSDTTHLTPVPDVLDEDEEEREFTPRMIIDFGDALFTADPLIDYTAVFVTILNSRQELGAKSMLLDSWRRLSKGKANDDKKRLMRRSMWHVLLWPSDGLSRHFAECVGLGEMKNWEQVEEIAFGWWLDL